MSRFPAEHESFAAIAYLNDTDLIDAYTDWVAAEIQGEYYEIDNWDAARLSEAARQEILNRLTERRKHT